MAQFWPSCSRGGLILQTIFKLICNIKYSTRPAIAQWESALVECGQIFNIPAIFLLFGKSLKCLYLRQISTNLHSVKKHLNASVLPQFLSTHLTSSFNFRKVQIWPRTFPLCTGDLSLVIFYFIETPLPSSETQNWA